MASAQVSVEMTNQIIVQQRYKFVTPSANNATRPRRKSAHVFMPTGAHVQYAKNGTKTDDDAHVQIVQDAAKKNDVTFV